MATRHLERLRAQLETESRVADEGGGGVDASDDEASESDDNTARPKKYFNPFDLLNDDEGCDEQEEEDEDQQSPVKASSITEEKKISTSSSKNKKRKAKLKKRNSAVKGEPVPEPAAHTSADEVDAALRELNISLVETAPRSDSTLPAPRVPLLSVQPRHLRPDEELRAVFGSSVLRLERQMEREAGSAQTRGNRPGPRGSRAPVIRRNLILVPSNTQRPPYDGSLSMAPVGGLSRKGEMEFEYVQGGAFRTAQMDFQEAQLTHNPNAIVAVLNRFPFHMDSLIAMYDLYTASNQMEYADRMLDMALYSLECAWHPHFKAHLMGGRARLPYLSSYNAVFYGPCTRCIRALTRRGTHRTALEWCKMVLSLDNTDPCGVLFQMDYLAIRSCQYSYLLELVQEWDGDQSLRLLPSFAFTCCLAEYYQFKEQQVAAGESGSTATGVHQEGDNDTLDAALVNAVLTFPTAVTELLIQLQDQGAGKDAKWASVLKRRHFATDNKSGTLQHLISIFVARNASVWKSADVLAWLYRACSHAADHVDNPDTSSNELWLDAKDADTLCDIAYPDSEVNEYQHLLVSSYTDVAADLPMDEVEGDAGAVPGVDMEQLEQLQQELLANGNHPALQAADLQGQNPLMMMLRTLMPWVNVEAPPADPGHGHDEPAGPGHGDNEAADPGHGGDEAAE